MIAIVLQILKIIGIVILVLLGILVSLILMALFVPVKYQAKGFYKDTYEVQARVTWLLHIVSARVVYSQEQALLIIVRLFGIVVFNNQKSAKRKEEQEQQEIDISNTQEQSQVKQVKLEPHNRPRMVDAKSAESEEKKSIDEKAGTDDKTVEGQAAKSEPSFWSRIRLVFDKLWHRLVNIKYTFEKIYGTINHIKENITYYMQLLQEETTKEAIGLCKKQLMRIIKNVKPKVFWVNIHLGMEDAPDTLGQILAIWGMTYPIHKGNIAMQAEFDKTVMEGDFLVKGRITLYVYLWTLYLFLFDKNIQRVKKSLLREEL